MINNRVFTAEMGERVLGRWRAIQARYGAEIRQSFAPLPVWDVPLFDREVVGLPMLSRMADVLFADRDPMKVYAPGPVQTMRKEREHYVLSLRLPFVSERELAVDKVGDELVVSVGNFRRPLFLPRALAAATVEEATLDAEWLRVRFKREGAPAVDAAAPRSHQGPRRPEPS